jgi:multidrug transporter EmrE-like cation transporter
LKVLLIPIAIVAFIVFIIVLGAIGLGIAFAILAALGKVWRLLGGAGRRVGRVGRRQRT